MVAAINRQLKSRITNFLCDQKFQSQIAATDCYDEKVISKKVKPDLFWVYGGIYNFFPYKIFLVLISLEIFGFAKSDLFDSSAMWLSRKRNRLIRPPFLKEKNRGFNLELSLDCENRAQLRAYRSHWSESIGSEKLTGPDKLLKFALLPRLLQFLLGFRKKKLMHAIINVYTNIED